MIDETELESPGLRSQALPLIASIYPKARRDAAKETGLPLSTFPPDCPYTLEQIRDPDWLPGRQPIVEPTAKRGFRPRAVPA